MPKLIKFLERNHKGVSSLLILTHDHPDPDSIASAYALQYLATQIFKIRTRISYAGSIGRVENQTMVRVLKIPIRELRGKQDFKWASHIALVDSQPIFSNNSFPSNRKPFIVIDHHPKHQKTRAKCLVVKQGYGATATILAELLIQRHISIPSSLITALVYAIGSETQNLGREASPHDVRVYLKLFPKCSARLLARIQNPPRPQSFFTTLFKVLKKAFSTGPVIGVHLGSIDAPELVSQMADFIISYERMTWSLCTGRYKDRLVVSIRTTNPRARAGQLLRKIITEPGMAGGHSMIAGGSVNVTKPKSELAWAEAEHMIERRFLKKIRPQIKEPELMNPFARRP